LSFQTSVINIPQIHRIVNKNKLEVRNEEWVKPCVFLHGNINNIVFNLN